MNSISCQAFDLDELTIDDVKRWSNADVLAWAYRRLGCSCIAFVCLRDQRIDGQVLLDLTEQDVRDMRFRFNYMMTLGELKKLWAAIHSLQLQFKEPSLVVPNMYNTRGYDASTYNGPSRRSMGKTFVCASAACRYEALEDEHLDCCAEGVPKEYLKTVLSLLYSFVVTWITSFAMVIVHERVPDMERYPPLPDIFLDNIPRIPWAFSLCEIVGAVLFIMWTCVCIFHKHRLVLLRRFFALAGTVFLLRCVTMLITSLSVPGSHLDCHKPEILEDGFSVLISMRERVRRAYYIWSGMGMSIQGVRTCGDYMFSGHTCALTLLNFFITEYTPRYMYYLHTFTWILNMFGVFFILAAHEHYSIDVFVAFYITSRLFLYYHTLANNHAQFSLDSTRTRIWFPMFYFFERAVDGVIPNEYDSVNSLCKNIGHGLISLKDFIIYIILHAWHEAKHFIMSRFFDETDGEIEKNGHIDRATSFNVADRPMNAQNNKRNANIMMNPR